MEQGHNLLAVAKQTRVSQWTLRQWRDYPMQGSRISRQHVGDAADHQSCRRQPANTPTCWAFTWVTAA
jgi:hypothetical protein